MRGERGSVSLFRHFSLSRNRIISISYRSSEKAILDLSPSIVDIPAILTLSTPPDGILCLCGSFEKAILLLLPWIVDIPAKLPLFTPPNRILCLCGSSKKAILPLSPWIYWNRKVQFGLVVALLHG
ncbi:hypothetical protein DY000_02023963 [Brassica cretica]|uniref:Uncharacterized protein n=1 Tax=Brassica cretica TaxID=69181 RepID=A0ABQ7EDH4_BRACR|nr:hypothetical protein DY000_02023963 [Brassica cretica]